jgi:threonine dehydratase
MTEITFQDIQKAHEVIKQTIPPSPLVFAEKLSQLYACEIYLKLENFHTTGSFKERGVLNKLSKLSKEQRKNGVIAMSAGNHAQALSYHASQMQIPATLVMPETAPFVKIRNTEKYGAKVILKGENLDESIKFTYDLAQKKGYTLIHPFDDEYVIAGQGTIGIEIFDCQKSFDQIIVPIGGGGLISGISTAAKELCPDCEIIGVESKLFPSTLQTLKGEAPECGGLSLADGISVKAPGHLTLPIIKKNVKEIILVDEFKIEQAILALSIDQKTIAEGAGAASLAAVMEKPDQFKGKKICLIICGGNIDRRILSSIYLRGMVREGRMTRLTIKISDTYGQLAKISDIISKERANIIEVYHNRLLEEMTAREATLDMVIETKNRDHIKVILEKLGKAGFPTEIRDTIS